METGLQGLVISSYYVAVDLHPSVSLNDSKKLSFVKLVKMNLEYLKNRGSTVLECFGFVLSVEP